MIIMSCWSLLEITPLSLSLSLCGCVCVKMDALNWRHRPSRCGRRQMAAVDRRDAGISVGRESTWLILWCKNVDITALGCERSVLWLLLATTCANEWHSSPPAAEFLAQLYDVRRDRTSPSDIFRLTTWPTFMPSMVGSFFYETESRLVTKPSHNAPPATSNRAKSAPP